VTYISPRTTPKEMNKHQKAFLKREREKRPRIVEIII
jgi:hypothetical protein